LTHSKAILHLYCWIPPILWAGLIFYLSHQTNPPGKGWGPDYLGHFILYGVFAFTLVRAVTKAWRETFSASSAWILWAAATLYGILDEFHQSFLPGRVPSTKDVVVDSVAAGLVVLVLYRLCRK
jgi:VanZ family protein